MYRENVTHITSRLKCLNSLLGFRNLEQTVEYWKQTHMSWFMVVLVKMVSKLTKFTNCRNVTKAKLSFLDSTAAKYVGDRCARLSFALKPL